MLHEALVTLAIVAALAFILIAAYAIVLYRHRQEAFASAYAALVSDSTITVTTLAGGHLLFVPTSHGKGVGKGVGAAYLQGALVHHHAYAPLCRDIARRSGLPVLLVRSRLRIAPFSRRVIGDALARAAQMAHVDRWAIGGHSLGGAMAATLAADGSLPDIVAGLYLHGAYLRSPVGPQVPVCQVLGERDGIVDAARCERGAALLSAADARVVTIAGGNHAGFGHYGPQRFPKPDGERTISLDEQQRRVAETTAAWLVEVVCAGSVGVAKACSTDKRAPMEAPPATAAAPAPLEVSLVSSPRRRRCDDGPSPLSSARHFGSGRAAGLTSSFCTLRMRG